MQEYLDSLSPEELLHVRPDYWALRFGPGAAKPGYAGKANFNPTQPRVPAGNSDDGQWTDTAGGQSTQLDRSESTDFSAVRRRTPGDRGVLPFPHFSPGPAPETPREAVAIVNNAQTGMSTVDETTEKLRATLEKVVNSQSPGVGPEYGKRIHYDFADAVRAENLPGVGRKGVEQSFNIVDRDVRYGSKESIRTDIVLKNEVGDVIAIYDVKTGNAYLDARRVQELREKTGASLRVPIIEMHTRRGLSLKAHIVQPRYFWVITLRLWNPWIRGMRGRRAA